MLQDGHPWGSNPAPTLTAVHPTSRHILTSCVVAAVRSPQFCWVMFSVASWQPTIKRCQYIWETGLFLLLAQYESFCVVLWEQNARGQNCNLVHSLAEFLAVAFRWKCFTFFPIFSSQAYLTTSQTKSSSPAKHHQHHSRLLSESHPKATCQLCPYAHLISSLWTTAKDSALV